MRNLEKRLEKLEKNIPPIEKGILVFGICGDSDNWDSEEQLYRDETRVTIQSYIPEIEEIDGMTLEQVREICKDEEIYLDIIPCRGMGLDIEPEGEDVF